MPRTSPTERADPHRSSVDLYDTDFHAWTVEQARLLRSGEPHLADLANIVEEIETLGRSERAALRSAYRLVALHLLKLIVQPDRASRSWFGTIARERNRVSRLLSDNPSLKPKRPDLFAAAYREARTEAAAETGLAPTVFPPEPPFTIEQAEGDFLPDAP